MGLVSGYGNGLADESAFTHTYDGGVKLDGGDCRAHEGRSRSYGFTERNTPLSRSRRTFARLQASQNETRPCLAHEGRSRGYKLHRTKYALVSLTKDVREATGFTERNTPLLLKNKYYSSTRGLPQKTRKSQFFKVSNVVGLVSGCLETHPIQVNG